MNKAQWISILSAVLIFVVLYFVLDTSPKDFRDLEKSRSVSSEQTSSAILIKDAKESINPADLASLELLEQEFHSTSSDSVKIEFGKRLSGRWFDLKQVAVAGHYAQLIAEIENQADSWGIAGTTFALCMQRSQNEVEKDYCTKRAIESFENAISLNPEASNHKVNLALVYADNPPDGNPMKGIQMLLGMNKENPDDVQVIKSLARLGMKTGQYEKALGRLLKAKSLTPEDTSIDCMLMEIYGSTDQHALAQKAREICEGRN